MLRRRALAIIVLAFLLGSCRGESTSEKDSSIDQERSYVVGVDRQYPPYSFVDENGEVRGFAIDLVREVGRLMELDLEVRTGSTAELRAALERGEIDLLPDVAASDGSEKRFALGLPHTNVADGIFVRVEQGSVENPEGVPLGEWLRRGPVVVVEDDPALDFLDHENIGERIVEKSVADALRRLAAGEGHCALLPSRPGLLLTQDLRLSNVQLMPASLDWAYSRTLSFAVRPADRELLDKLEQGLVIVTQTGTYLRLYNEWQQYPTGEPRWARWLVPILIAVLALLALFTVWSWSLRRTVALRTAELRLEATERRRAQEALTVSEKKYRGLFDSSIDAIALCNLESRLLDANPACVRLLGYPLEALRRRNLNDLLSEANLVESAHQPSMSLTGIKCFVERSDGTTVPVSFRLWRVADENGKEVAFWALLRDLTEEHRNESEKRAFEAQLAQAQRLESLGVLAGGVAHDFNNLLMGILGNTSLAIDDLGPSPVADRLQEVEKAGRRAAELCQQMLAYSGKGKFALEPIDLSVLIDDIGDLLGSAVSKKAGMLRHLAADLPTIDGDSGQLRQVIVNLVTNAAEAIGDQAGTIRIRTEAVSCTEGQLRRLFLGERLKQGRYVCLEVSDTGTGIDANAIGRIFEPFYTTKFLGRGLGLAATLGIVRGHGGALGVESEPGRGTTFRVFFPVSRKAQQSRSLESNRSGSWQTTVLVVDDEELTRNVLRRYLEVAGHRVLVAKDGEEGLEALEAHRDIGLVLLDATMPKRGGEEILFEIRERRPFLPVILCSGYRQAEANPSRKVRPDAFVQKPFDSQTLTAIVNQVLSQVAHDGAHRTSPGSA
jgi:PAS domain S-box-containing protein